MVVIKNLMTASILGLMMLGYSVQAILISISLIGIIILIKAKHER